MQPRVRRRPCLKSFQKQQIEAIDGYLMPSRDQIDADKFTAHSVRRPAPEKLAYLYTSSERNPLNKPWNQGSDVGERALAKEYAESRKVLSEWKEREAASKSFNPHDTQTYPENHTMASLHVDLANVKGAPMLSAHEIPGRKSVVAHLDVDAALQQLRVLHETRPSGIDEKAKQWRHESPLSAPFGTSKDCQSDTRAWKRAHIDSDAHNLAARYRRLTQDGHLRKATSDGAFHTLPNTPTTFLLVRI
ncbi:MAG: hypothetical protein MHM6MM_002013 [Cercozoa sp. M6MM]